MYALNLTQRKKAKDTADNISVHHLFAEHLQNTLPQSENIIDTRVACVVGEIREASTGLQRRVYYLGELLRVSRGASTLISGKYLAASAPIPCNNPLA